MKKYKIPATKDVVKLIEEWKTDIEKAGARYIYYMPNNEIIDLFNCDGFDMKNIEAAQFATHRLFEDGIRRYYTVEQNLDDTTVEKAIVRLTDFTFNFWNTGIDNNKTPEVILKRYLKEAEDKVAIPIHYTSAVTRDQYFRVVNNILNKIKDEDFYKIYAWVKEE